MAAKKANEVLTKATKTTKTTKAQATKAKEVEVTQTLDTDATKAQEEAIARAKAALETEHKAVLARLDKSNEPKDKDGIESVLRDAAKLYNEFVLDGKYTEAKPVDDRMSELVNKYTGLCRAEMISKVEKAPDPMLEAVKMLTFKTLRIKDTKNKEDGTIKRDIVDADKTIDLRKLNKELKTGIGHDKQWVYKLEKFNMLMTARVAQRLGIDPKSVSNSYAMASISKKIDLGKDPASDENLHNTLNSLVKAMIGDNYDIANHDVEFLKEVYSKKNRAALKVSCADHRHLCQYVAEICHRIVMKESYTIDFKAAKK